MTTPDRRGLSLRRRLTAGLVLLAAWAGCGDSRPQVVPVRGQVFYQGQPLRFGSVMFQPAAGWPARGVIQPDGSFQLSTYEANDGAVPGLHRVRIVCVDRHNPTHPPSANEPRLGVPLIPAKYSDIETSGLTVTVEQTNEPFVFHLEN